MLPYTVSRNNQRPLNTRRIRLCIGDPISGAVVCLDNKRLFLFIKAKRFKYSLMSTDRYSNPATRHINAKEKN